MGRFVREGRVPVAFAAALLLRLLGVGAGEAGLGEVAREMSFRIGGAVSQADVVAVVVLV